MSLHEEEPRRSATMEGVRADGWVLVGAPWDCSGTGRGELDAPAALRAAGLSDLVGEDVGDAATHIRSTERDAATGVRALEDTVRAARDLTATLSRTMSDSPGRRPLVVGGDCSVLLGIAPALRAEGRFGLWFVDGHPDLLDGADSDTGETADMDLAVLIGRGTAPLLGLSDAVPMVAAEDVGLLGHPPAGSTPRRGGSGPHPAGL